MKKKYFNILIILSIVFLLFPAKILAQKDQKDNYVKIESVVTDENGNPIKGATVYGNEGAIVSKTDDSGKFSILVPPQTSIFVESNGYESRLFKQGEIDNIKSFQLKNSESLYGEKDNVNIPFRVIKKGDVIGSLTVIEPDEITEYDNNQSVSTALTGRVTGMLGSSNIRGIGSPLFLVDGLPRDVSSITMDEVDQITVLKDVNSSVLYGSRAVNGIVMITTKRGEAYKQTVKVNGYYGVSSPLRLPNYLSSADYMELYNEARLNDGLSAPYDPETIENYRTGNKYRYPSVDYYSSEYLKSFKPYFKASTELSGGNEVASYYSNIGWANSGSLIDFGEGKNGGNNRFNVRGNVDLNINKYVKGSIDAVAVFDNTSGARGSYWSNAATYRPHLFSPLVPISLVVPGNEQVEAHKTDIDGMYLLGGTSSYQNNDIAEGFAGGKLQTMKRTFSFNNRIDVDLNDLLKGLSFHTNFGFDLYSQFQQTIDNDYSVYMPTWDADVDSITALTQFGTDARSGSQNIGDTYFERRFSFSGAFNYDRTFNDIHHVSGTLSAFGNKFKKEGDEQGQKDINFGLSLTYALNKKYLANFSSSYMNSVKMPEDNRLGFSPSLGLAWVISSEDFMSSLNFIDYLKIKATGGIHASDAGIDGFYYYDNKYTTSSSYAWYEGTYSNSGVVSSYGGNMSLGFERRKEINFGFEGMFFNNMIGVEANVFKSQYYDQVTRPSSIYPSFYSNFIPYENFDNNEYRGAEIGITFNKKIGDFNISVGATGLYATSEVVEKDEIYANDYQYREGKSVDSRFALVADGFFTDQNDIDNHAYQEFGTVQPGDIKYVDQNNDGVVNDNDQVRVGRSQAPYSFGLDLRINYKCFTLFATGNGRFGADNYRSSSYYWIDGDDKYSEIVNGRWTPETKETADYPRLSSISNSNNFRNSTFWLFKDNYFDLQRVQLSYELPERVANLVYMKRLSCYADVSNLYTFSDYREVKDLNIGSEPQYRSFTIGIKTTF